MVSPTKTAKARQRRVQPFSVAPQDVSHAARHMSRGQKVALLAEASIVYGMVSRLAADDEVTSRAKIDPEFRTWTRNLKNKAAHVLTAAHTISTLSARAPQPSRPNRFSLAASGGNLTSMSPDRFRRIVRVRRRHRELLRTFDRG